ncbi:MAG: hypothetical protein EBT07_03785 [Actinobacteria bacterium]|jgi:hypothetical protein|nr:hypothetical protein [Actinomycetota bacterium]
MEISSQSAPWNSAWNRINSTDMMFVKDQQSQGMFSYTQMPVKFENPNKCRNALGLVGGSEVSNINGNLVDLESDLFGITRAQSKCIARQYIPSCALGGPGCPDVPAPFSFTNMLTGETRTVDTSPRNLPTCQNTTLPGVGTPEALRTGACYPNRF